MRRVVSELLYVVPFLALAFAGLVAGGVKCAVAPLVIGLAVRFALFLAVEL